MRMRAVLTVLRRRLQRTVPIEHMPGHPERVRLLPDPIEQEAFGDIAEALLDDGMWRTVERLRWMR